MEITSVYYFIFVGVSLFIYWLLPRKAQWILLLADSLLFYFVSISAYTFIYVVISVLSVYGVTMFFSRTDSKKRKKIALLCAIVVNAGLLVLLKYTNMFIGTANLWFGINVHKVGWLAPLAISYYTLQLIAYVVDCYGGLIEPEKNPLKLLLFTCFFPLLISGPICRYSQIGGQLFEEHRFDYDRVVSGMRRVLWGLAKKIVVADHLALIANCMFDNPDTYSGIWVLIAAMVFIVELYFDFSGCMDIVIGVSKCFGIILPENFNAPFLSRSVQEFWQRWHMTLGNWLKDYVMYPISRTGAFRKWSRKCKKKWGRGGQKIPYYVAMFVVWTLMGIWHGSSWKYMIGEGWYFFLVIVSGQILEPVFKKWKTSLHIKDESGLWHAFQVVRTFVLAAIGNIAFRADSLSQTFYMMRRAFVWTGIKEPLLGLKENIFEFGGKDVLALIGVLVILQIFSDVRLYYGKSTQDIITKRPIAIRWGIYLVTLFIVMFYSVAGETTFVYFQF